MLLIDELQKEYETHLSNCSIREREKKPTEIDFKLSGRVIHTNYIYVYMYVCMYIYIYVCMYLCMYIYMCVCIYECIYICVCVMYVCMYVCMYACIYMYVSIYVHVRMYLMPNSIHSRTGWSCFWLYMHK